MLGISPAMEIEWKCLASTWIHLLILNLFVLTILCDTSSYSCGPGSDYGVTLPRGDILVEYGQPLKILCMVNLNHVQVGLKNASSLYFVHNNTEVASNLIRIINESTIELYDEHPLPSVSVYSCRLRHDDSVQNPSGIGICINKVFVGYHPSKAHATNFSCISYNWANFTCTWTSAVNYIKTNYQISMQEMGKGALRIGPIHCPNEMSERNSCSWSSMTNPPYRKTVELYNVTLKEFNSFGQFTQSSIFNQSTIVLPDKPELQVLNVTSSSILIFWKIPYPLHGFSYGLKQKIKYKSYFGDWQEANTSHLNLISENYTFNLTNLPSANTTYDIRVYMKSATAVSDTLWSEPAIAVARTLPDVPSVPPLTNVGSFEISSSYPYHERDVYIYWQKIPLSAENGDGISYKVIEVKENGIVSNLSPSYVQNSYAKFSKLTNNAYEFKIISSNKIGDSKDSARVFVPKKQDMPSGPSSVIKVAYEHGVYQLSWKASQQQDSVDNYTIFWCNTKHERPFQCDGALNWTVVNKSVFIHNITLGDEKDYQFAVSANSLNGSSGMVWAECTIIHNRASGEMKNVWATTLNATQIEIKWKLDCSSKPGVVQGFQVFFCPLKNSKATECTEPERIKTVGDQDFAVLENLKPYKTYKMSVAVLTSETGPRSNPINATTLEAAPDQPPLNILATNRTNTTVDLKWDPPPEESQNGVVRYYQIRYDSYTLNTVSNETKAHITGLKSDEEYLVNISACTVYCSSPSNVSFRTDIGAPGIIEQPSVKSTNTSVEFIVSWAPPIFKGGNISYYEIEISENSDKPNSVEILRANTTKKVISCASSKTKSKDIRVRAVNKKDNTLFYGPWSPTGTAPCTPSPGLFQLIWIALYIIFFVVLGGCIIFLVRKSWQRYAEMKNCGVTLPPRLNATCNEASKENDPSLPMQNWSPQTRKEETPPRKETSADEELLLQKKEGCNEPNEINEDSETKHNDCSSQVENFTISTVDNHEENNSDRKSQKSYSDSEEDVVASTPKEITSDESNPYCKIGGGYVSFTPASAPSTASQVQSPISESYIPSKFEAPAIVTYVKTFNMPNPAQLYCRIGLSNADLPPMQDSETKLLSKPDSRYVTLANDIKHNRGKNSIPI